MSYSLIALYATGSSGTAALLQKFNKNKALRPGDKTYIPRRLVRKELQVILDENKFETFTIDAEEAPSLAAIMETNCNIAIFGYRETLAVLLVINDDINFANPIMHDKDPIIIPISLLSKDLVIEEEKETPKQIQPKEVLETPKLERIAPSADSKLMEKMARYQNPFRLAEQRVLASIRPQDKFGAARIRTGGGRVIYGARHKGLDLPCAVGTPLFPLGVGRVSLVRDYHGSSFWRNGKVVEVKLGFGYKVKYLHLSKFHKGLQAGDPVDLDTVVGYSGISGNASAHNPHVHIQVQDPNGKVINPLPFVAVSSGEGQHLTAELQASVGRNKEAYVKLFRLAETKAK